jgi:GT2 family glycosyltransferase
MHRVSVVIVSFNTRDLLDRCIATVLAGSPNLEKEIIIVENASADGTREMLAEKYPTVKVILNDVNRGYAPACNQGLKLATAPYKLALNSDAFPIDNALETMVEFMENNPDVAALEPKLLNADGSIQRTCARKPVSLLAQFVVHSAFYHFLPMCLQNYGWRVESEDFYNSTHDADVISGACILFRSSALDRIGLLDDRLIVGCDDVEWSTRAKRAGERLVYYPDAQVTHLVCQSRNHSPEDMRPYNIRTFSRYFEIMYSPAVATLLKLYLLANLLPPMARNAILAPFSSKRRDRLSEQAEMLGQGWNIAFREKPPH